LRSVKIRDFNASNFYKRGVLKSEILMLPIFIKRLKN
jgi:hypothetical protein